MTALSPVEPAERSYREKVAWISLMTTALLYVPYFVIISRWWAQGTMLWPQVLVLLAGVAVLHAVLLPLGLLAWWLLGQRAADLPADERDRAIDASATRAAYFTLIAGGFTLPFALLSFQAGTLAQPAVLLQGFFFCFVLAEVVRFARQVLGYRRGV